MEIVTYYIKKTKTWAAYTTVNGVQVGNTEYAATKEVACFYLGISYVERKKEEMANGNA